MDNEHNGNWNLNYLFKESDDLESISNDVINKTMKFANKFKGKLNNIKSLSPVIEEYELLKEEIVKILSYSFLLFAKNTNEGGQYSKYELLMNEAMSNILFFDLELIEIDDLTTTIEQRVGDKYKYYVEKLIENKPHQLSLKEEQIILALSPVGQDAFTRYFDEFIARIKFRLDDKFVLAEEILSNLHHADRGLRKKSAKSITKQLKKSSHTLAYIINNMRKNLKINNDLRGFKYPEESRNIDNQISKENYEILLETANNNVHLVEQYYKLKSKIMGIKRLKDYDRYAPLISNNNNSGDSFFNNISFSVAKELILDSFKEFHPLFSEITKVAFNEKWIDVFPINNKISGAFSHSTVPSAHPYVLLNYTNNRRDVFTLAHELGHAIHQELSKKQGLLNADTPLTIAETASVFSEMLLFDSLKNKLKDNKNDLLELLASKIEDIFSTLFRQIVMTNFEKIIHNNIDELSIQELNNIWLQENKKMFGKSIKLRKDYALWWSYIPHFIHTPFYCYAYSYGQLLSLTLFGICKEDKEKANNYINLLKSGGSNTPQQLIKNHFNLDINDKSFWLIGIKELEKLIKEFENLI